MFGLKRSDGTKVQAMIPVGDLFNHHNPPAIEWAWGSLGDLSGVYYTAIEDIPKDSPATYSYGSKSNYQLLSQYGFVDLKNTVRITPTVATVSIAEDDPLRDLKRSILGDAESFQITIRAEFEHPMTQDAISILRVILFDDEDNIETFKRHAAEFATTGLVPPICNSCETKTLRKLVSLCNEKIARYPGTFQGDQQIYLQKGLPVNQKNAYHVTLSERAEIMNLIQDTNRIIELLGETKEYFRQVIRKPSPTLITIYDVLN